MHDTEDAKCLRLTDQRPRVLFRVSRVNNHRFFQFSRQCDLSAKSCALRVARRIVVVIVEAALADRDRTALEEFTKPGNVTALVERSRVVWMDPGCGEHKTRIVGRALSRESRYLERLSDANDGRRARIASTGDYRVAVAGEGRVREVGVAVDEA